MTASDIQSAIKKVSQQEHLSQAEAQAAMRDIMTGQATPAQVGAYLMGLRLKGETPDEITGSARAMRDVVNRVSLKSTVAIDTCGTGGDGANTFNISTTVGFVAAAAGVPVAKHGNRAISSKSGSSDVLSALGVIVALTPVQVAACVDEVGIGFMFAPGFHPAMKHAIAPRRELAIRTIFNLLGPLTNPAGVNRQVLGVYDRSLTGPLARVLHSLGGERVFVVHGEGGLDELSTLGANSVSEIRDGTVQDYEFHITDYGLNPATVEDIQGGDANVNAQITRDVLGGGGTQAQREIVMLNAAAALVVGGKVDSLEDGLQSAATILDNGAALDKLNALVEFSRQFAPETA
jgi:anthranilate phosphoribosyltransferase